MGHDVFISHSSKDKAVSDAACALLERRGFRCWMAPRDILPGQEWGEAIVDGIRGARIFVLIFSSNANFSQQVRREVERAAGNGLPIVPFRIEDVQPARSLEYFISNQHWLDALNPPIERHLDYLGDVVERLLAGPGTAGPAPRPPAGPARPRARSSRGIWAGLLLFAALVAGALAYVLSRPGPAIENNLVAAENAVVENRAAPAPSPPRLVPQALRPLIDIAATQTSPGQGSFVPAAPLLLAAHVPVRIEALSPDGAQLQIADGRSLDEAMWFGGPRNLLTLETPTQSPSGVTLRFAEPVAEIRLVRARFGSRFENMVAATADNLAYPAFTVEAYGTDSQPVDRQRRDPISSYYGGGEVAADAVTLRSAGGISAIRLTADNAIVLRLVPGRPQRTFHAFMFESVMVRRMPQPAAAAPER